MAANSVGHECISLLSNGELFWWGVLGGLISYSLLVALPFFNTLIQAVDFRSVINGRKVVGYIGILIVACGIGGLSPIIFGDATHDGQALVYGLVWPGVMSGLGNISLVIGSLLKP